MRGVSRATVRIFPVRHPQPEFTERMNEMKRIASRILSLVLAIALVMSMSLTAFALDGHEMYMSPATGTSYTTMATSSTTSVPLEVCFTAYNEGYYTTGFDSADQAKAVSWTVTYNDDGLVNNTVAVSSGVVNSVITSKGTVTLNAGVTGVAVVHAAYNGLTLDLVIARDTTGVQSDVAAKVYVVDVTSSDDKLIVDNETVTVKAPANKSGSILAGKSCAFQNQPTAMGTLDMLLNEDIESVTLSDDGSYANAINGLYYWGYAVYSSTGALVDISQVTSASIFALSSGQTVVWKYGAWSFASTLAAEVASW